MTGEVVNHLWQSTVFAILAGLLTLAFRKNRAQVRYWIWFSASVKFLVPAALLLTLGGYLGRSAAAKSIPVPPIPYTLVGVAVPFPATPTPIPSPQQNANWIPSALVSLWACGFAGLALIRLRGWLRIRAAVRTSAPLETPFSIPLRSSVWLMEPGVVGVFRPVLLFPAGILARLSPKELQAILAHESCHVRRHDNLTAAIHMLVEAVFWFNPLVWWISTRLMEERERACDEGVMELGNDPQDYAESIVKTCQFCVESPLTCVAGVTGADLERRIVRIMTQRVRTKLNFSRKLLLAGFAMAAVLGPLVLGLKVGARVFAQSGPPSGEHRPAFEVASIKPYPGCENKQIFGGTWTPSPDRVAIPCVNLRRLILTAYGTYRDGVTEDQQALHIEGGPAWMQSEYYSVSAKALAPPAHPQMMLGPMLQTLLEERFQLKTHREMREMPVYAMTVGKRGLKVQRLAQVACTAYDPVHPKPSFKPGSFPNVCGLLYMRRTGTGDMSLDMLGSTMTQFAQPLSRLSGRPVVDRTSIAGQFNFHLEFTPDPAIAVDHFPGGRRGDAGNVADLGNPLPTSEGGPDLFVALQEQLGLKLTSHKGPVSVLIIDHAEKPSAN
jgi:bla regulator protein blaR1